MLSTFISYIPDWAIWVQAGVALLVPLSALAIYKTLYSYVGSGRGTASSGGSKDKLQPKPAIQQTSSGKAGFSGNITEDMSAMKSVIGGNSDLNFREFTLTKLQKKVFLFM